MTMSRKLIALFLVGFFCTLALGGAIGSRVVHAISLSRQGSTHANSVLMAGQTPPVMLDTTASPALDSHDGFVPSGMLESDNPTGNRQVIGEDDRLPMTSRAYPWSAIGRLEHVDATGEVTTICTGSLIGNDLVLTNAHCVVDENTHRLTRNTLRFRPNLIADRSRTSAVAQRVRYGDNGKDGFFGENDWAIIRLNQPIGRQQGTIGWRNLSTENLRNLGRKISLVGYSADFPPNRPGQTAGVHRGCSVLGDGDFGFLVHNCDTFGGASGGPLLAQINGKFYIVAIHAGTYDRVNRAIKVARWAQSAAEMQ